MDLNEYKRLKKRVEELKDSAKKAEVREEYLLRQLKEEFLCDSLEDAETLLKKRVEELEEEGREYERELEKFSKKYGERLR